MKNMFISSGVILLIFLLQSCKKVIKESDGNVYNTVTIGTQVWMKENLRTTKYRNGDLIGTTTPANMNIYAETTPKYQWAYGGNESNVATYGRLYTWYAATDNRNVCPAGWHVPTDAEWTVLTDYLINNGYGYQGSASDIGKSMASTSGWTTYVTAGTAGTVGNDQASNNSSGFTALPGGYRFYYGTYKGGGESGYWWSSTEYATAYAWLRSMEANKTNVDRYSSYFDKATGFSIRCVKDE